jgi:hypothetical protein
VRVLYEQESNTSEKASFDRVSRVSQVPAVITSVSRDVIGNADADDDDADVDGEVGGGVAWVMKHGVNCAHCVSCPCSAQTWSLTSIPTRLRRAETVLLQRTARLIIVIDGCHDWCVC